MTITQLRATIKPRWVSDEDLRYVTAALPTGRGSLAVIRDMDDITRELTTGLHAIRTPSGRRWLVATDMFRIHALELDRQSPLPSGSYRLEADGLWTRYAATIDTSNLAPYLAPVDGEPPSKLHFSKRLVDLISRAHCDHPDLLVCVKDGVTRLYSSAEEMRLVEEIPINPVKYRAVGPGEIAVQWPVMAMAAEAGMTRWTGAGLIGPYRSAAGNRLAVFIGIQVTAPAVEATA